MSKEEKPTSLDALDQKLKAARRKQENPKGRSAEGRGGVQGAAVGLRIAIDFIAGIAVGLGLGLYIDTQFETKPLFLIIFSIVGFVAGLMNVIRTARNLEAREKREREERQAAER